MAKKKKKDSPEQTRIEELNKEIAETREKLAALKLERKQLIK